MTSEEQIKELWHLAHQIPNPYIRGAMYPATMTNGTPVMVRYTAPGFLRITKKARGVLKSPTGEVINRYDTTLYFRANMRTGEVTEL